MEKANTSERLGAVLVLDEHRDRFSHLEVVLVDEGYSGENFERVVRQVYGEQVRVKVIKEGCHRGWNLHSHLSPTVFSMPITIFLLFLP
nr:hypothetical protein [Acaryochloris sp. IP29b_bin.148]